MLCKFFGFLVFCYRVLGYVKFKILIIFEDFFFLIIYFMGVIEYKVFL